MDVSQSDDDELPSLIDPDNESNDLPNLINSGRTIAMPSECTTNPLQRALADSIIRMVSLDELRILFACGAKVSESFLELRWSRPVVKPRQHCLRSFVISLRRKSIHNRVSLLGQ